MADSNVFRHGQVQYPLTADTTNSLLRDADPALYYALDFFAAVLRIHIGERLLAQAALEGLKFPDAVVRTLNIEPSPHLLAHQLQFPLLAIYRRHEDSDSDSITVDKDVSELEFSYVLPPLNPRQLEQLYPILRAASRVIAKAARKGFDNGYNNGQRVWPLAGIERARVTRASYGVYEPIDEVASSFRAVVGTIKMAELDDVTDDTLDPLDGVTGSIHLKANDGTTVADVAVASTYPAPTISTIVPSLGTKAGGTTVTITGSGFRVGTPVRVLVDGTDCTSATVLSTTIVRAVTAPHEAYPTMMADVVVIADDGQQATLPAAFSFTSP